MRAEGEREARTMVSSRGARRLVRDGAREAATDANTLTAVDDEGALFEHGGQFGTVRHDDIPELERAACGPLGRWRDRQGLLL